MLKSHEKLHETEWRTCLSTNFLRVKDSLADVPVLCPDGH
jgi:hypothetical protein